MKKIFRQFEAQCKEYLRKVGEENFTVWVTMSYTAPGKETNFFTAIKTGERPDETVVYFRSMVKMALPMKYYTEDICADVLAYLQDGFRIESISPQCCSDIWDEIDHDFVDSYRELKRGEQLFLAYCSGAGITRKFLEGKVGGYVPDVMGRWERGTEAAERNSNTLIPERTSPGYGFDGGRYPEGMDGTDGMAEFIKECYIQLFQRRWKDFNFEFLMQKQRPDEKVDIIALVCCDDEMVLLRKGRVSTERDEIAASSEVSGCFFQYLKAGFQIEYISMLTNGVLWEELSEKTPEYLQQNRQEVETYLVYCQDEGITRNILEWELECDIPDFMALWQDSEKSVPGTVPERRKNLIYSQEEIHGLAERIRGFLLENHLAAEYIDRFHGDLPPGIPIPDLETVIDSGSLRYVLNCYLCHKVSQLPDNVQKRNGRELIDALGEMEYIPKRKKTGGLETAAWEAAELLKELDMFRYAQYMKSGDTEADPVRRIYGDLLIPEKRLALSETLLTFAETEHKEKIFQLVDTLQEYGKEQKQAGYSAGTGRCR